MALMKPPPTKTDSFEDYVQPIDALNGLPTTRHKEVMQARRSYRLISDKKMQQVRDAAGGRRSSSAERIRPELLEPDYLPPPAARPKARSTASHPLPDYEEPWDLRLPAFQRAFRKDSPPEAGVPRPPPPQVPPPPAPVSNEEEYEDPWDSTRRAVHPFVSHEPLPPVVRPPKPAHLNGEYPRSLSVPSRGTRAQSEPPEIDTNIFLEDQPWYHGMIGRHHAEEVLSRKPDFSFLVRKSETSLTSYSLSLKCSSQMDTLPYIHIKIDMDNDLGYVVGEFSKPFPNIPEAIKYYTSHKLRIRGADHKKLKHPVSRGE